MKLAELNPHWLADAQGRENAYLAFDCPRLHERRGMKCQIALPIKPTENGWQMTAIQPAAEMFREPTWDEVSITPSVWHHCEKDPHFFITNGEIVFV